MVKTPSKFELKFDILTHGTAAADCDLYNRTYLLWKSVWNETFLELGTDTKVNGDDFYFLDELCTLHIQREPIAMIAIKWLNTNLLPAVENHYFQTYPPETLRYLSERGLTTFMGLGNLVTHPDWRKQKTKFPYADLVAGLAFERQKQFGAESCLCYTRNNRGINKMICRFGGTPLWTNLIRHNVNVDVLIVPTPQIVRHPDVQVNEMVRFLWNQWMRRKHQKPQAA
jgi:hypothetical protein